MQYELFAVVSISFFLICFLQQILDIRRNKTVQISNIFGFMFSITYGILPAIYVLSYFLHGKTYVRIRYSTERLNDLWIWLLLAIVGYFVFRVSYKLKWRNEKQPIEDIQQEKKYDIDDFMRLQITCIVCLAIGLVSLYLWGRAYGGVLGRIKVANLIRSGILKINNPFDILKHSSRLLFFVSYSSLLLLKRRYRKILNICILAISGVFSVLFLFACDGRMGMATYFVILLLIATDIFGGKTKIGKKLIVFTIVGIVALLIVMEMDGITYYIRHGETLVDNGSTKDGLLSEFGYILMSGQNAVHLWETEGTPFLIFQDLFSGLFSWLPHALKPADFVIIWDFNTALCESAETLNAQIPTDYVSTTLYDLGILGVFIFGFVFGRIIRAVDIARKKNKNLFYEVFYYSFALIILRYVNYCMFYDFILYMFYLFVAMIIWKATKVLMNSKRKGYK